MKTAAIALCVLVTVSAAVGQNYNAAINRAHRAVDQTQQASQGNQPGIAPQAPAPSQPSPNPPPPPDPALQATLQNIASLRADFDGLKTNVPPAPAFTNHLAAAAMGEKKASADTVARFAGDLRAALGDNDRLAAQHQKLAQDIHALFNRASLSNVQAMTVSNDVQRILRAGEVPLETILSVDDDIQKVADETK